MRFAIFDGHCDTAVECYHAGKTPLSHWRGHVTLDSMKRIARYAQFFAFCTVQLRDKTDPAAYFDACFASFRKDLAHNGDTLTLCGSAAQIRTAWQTGKTAALLSVEGAEAISCDEGRLEQLAQAGFRMVTLTWNYANALCGSHLTGEGLTQKGKNFVRRAQELGIILDVSHLSDRGFYDLCDLTQAPLAASHSNSRALCPHSRNLTDEMFRLIAESGGTVGLNLYPVFLTGTERACFDDVYRHAEHFLSLGGENALALGGDLDGIPVAPVGFGNAADYETLLTGLSARGISDAVLEKICSGNLLRVMQTAGCKPI